MTTPDQSPAPEYPYRLVDAKGQGWHGRTDGTEYTADYDFKRDLEKMSHAELQAQRGPLRPVVPVPDADAEAIVAALRSAGRRAAASTARALYLTYCAVSDLPAPDCVLKAGREGSWEAESMMRLVWIGSDLDSPKRLHEHAVAAISQVLTGWVTSEDHFVEVAENLASLFSRAAALIHRDETQLAHDALRAANTDGKKSRARNRMRILTERGGTWHCVADQHLMPGALSESTGESLYFYLMSQTHPFDHGLYSLETESPIVVELRERSIEREVAGDGDPAHHDSYRAALYDAELNRPRNNKDPQGAWIAVLARIYEYSRARETQGDPLQPTYRRALVDLVSTMVGEPPAQARTMLERHDEE